MVPADAAPPTTVLAMYLVLLSLQPALEKYGGT
jgi:hypothetical protein